MWNLKRFAKAARNSLYDDYDQDGQINRLQHCISKIGIVLYNWVGLILCIQALSRRKRFRCWLAAGLGSIVLKLELIRELGRFVAVRSFGSKTIASNAISGAIVRVVGHMKISVYFVNVVFSVFIPPLFGFRFYTHSLHTANRDDSGWAKSTSSIWKRKW